MALARQRAGLLDGLAAVGAFAMLGLAVEQRLVRNLPLAYGVAILAVSLGDTSLLAHAETELMPALATFAEACGLDGLLLQDISTQIPVLSSTRQQWLLRTPAHDAWLNQRSQRPGMREPLETTVRDILVSRFSLEGARVADVYGKFPATMLVAAGLHRAYLVTYGNRTVLRGAFQSPKKNAGGGGATAQQQLHVHSDDDDLPVSAHQVHGKRGADLLREQLVVRARIAAAVLLACAVAIGPPDAAGALAHLAAVLSYPRLIFVGDALRVVLDVLLFVVSLGFDRRLVAALVRERDRSPPVQQQRNGVFQVGELRRMHELRTLVETAIGKSAESQGRLEAMLSRHTASGIAPNCAAAQSEEEVVCCAMSSVQKGLPALSGRSGQGEPAQSSYANTRLPIPQELMPHFKLDATQTKSLCVLRELEQLLRHPP